MIRPDPSKTVDPMDPLDPVPTLVCSVRCRHFGPAVGGSTSNSSSLPLPSVHSSSVASALRKNPATGNAERRELVQREVCSHN